MANLTWIKVFAMCITSAFISFLGAGVISIYQHAIACFITRNEEIDYEL
ncbi:MAG: hypothetical protein KC484_07280 [Colwelliaceae bacterium]|jgi:hypothetical protein|nr:hypothetical protein [Colwelliaceae bacterium]